MNRGRNVLFAGLVLAALAVFVSFHSSLRAASSGALLTGSVTSSSGEKMRGVTVSAQKEGQTITTSVFTDESGSYYFPASLEDGHYRVWAQAEGYEFQSAGVDVNASVQHQDFTMKPAKDVIKQMTGDEYLAALPEDTPEHRLMKEVLYDNCTSCHPPSYILQNRFDEAGWTAILNTMRKEGAFGDFAGADAATWPEILYYQKRLAAYLAEMRGPGPSPMKVKLNPRPSGDAARAVFTEYDLPVADSEVYHDNNGGYATNNGSDWSLGTPSSMEGVHGNHDAQMDMNGNIWFTYPMTSRVRTLAMVNTKTGEVTSVKIPGHNGFAASTHGLTMDQKGILWFTLAGAGDMEGGVGGIGSIDPNTKHFETYFPPKGMPGVSGSIDVDVKGNIWETAGLGALRFDPTTKEFTQFGSSTLATPNGPRGTYGVATDRDGNGWWTQFSIDMVEKSNLSSPGDPFVVTLPHRVPSAEKDFTLADRKVYELSGVVASFYGDPWNQGPRRLGGDKSADIVWVADYWGSNLAKFDIHTLKPTFYPIPRPQASPYDAVVSKNHHVFLSLTNGDGVLEFDPKTEHWTQYPLPTHGVQMRHISIFEGDGSTQIVLSYERTGRVARLQFRSKSDLEALKSQAQQTQQARMQ